MAYINKSIIRKKALRSLERKNTANNKIYQKINVAFQRKKNQLINDFENHPVTQEIRGGPNSANISGTLGGYGNLYTFIGFDGGDPTSAVSAALRSGVRLVRRPIKRRRGKSVLYTFKILYPDATDMRSVAPMPWETGNWVDRIEKGISGLGHYIYSRYISSVSRSGGGIQAKGKIRSATYSRISYLSTIFATFRKGWRL